MGENGYNSKILIVDDEKVIADTLAMILTLKGYKASAVYDGEQAVAAATKSAPDVLITDVVMSGMNGIEAAIAIRRLCPDCRVILFSGQLATAEILATANGNGHRFEILAKPVHPDMILERLQSKMN